MKQNRKVLYLIFVLILTLSLTSEVTDFKSFIYNFLMEDSEYIRKQSKLQLLRAKKHIRQSENIFDINFEMKSYENNVRRNQTDYKHSLQTENSVISEKDDQMRVSVSKKFFDKDFDTDSDNIVSNLEFLREKYELQLFETIRMNELAENCILYYQVSMNLDVLEQELELYIHQRDLIEKLYNLNVATAEDFSGILKKIAKTETAIADDNTILNELAGFSDQVFINLLDAFETNSDSEITLDIMNAEAQKKIQKLHQDITKQSRFINLKYLYLYLPETSLTFSYNKRSTIQDWDVTEDGTDLYFRERDFKEEYPEIGLEFSLPINLYSNIKGKTGLLTTYKKQAEVRETQLVKDTNILAANLHNEYLKNKKLFELQKLIFELKKKSFRNLSQKYLADPSILSITPEETLKQKELELREEEIEFITAKLRLNKIIFICANFIGN